VIAQRVRGLPLLELAALGAAVVCLVAFGLLGQTKNEGAVDTYSTYDAGAGGVRAWYELLEREGVRVSRYEERTAFLDRSIGALIAVDTSFLDPRTSDSVTADGPAIAGWVRDGGRLLVAGNGMLTTFGRRQLQLPNTAILTPHQSRLVAPPLSAYGVSDVQAADGARFVVRKGDRVLLRDASGPLAVRYALGKGWVVALSDAEVLRNVDIGRPDRARLAYGLAMLLAAGKGPAAVAFDEALHGYVAPVHWWQVLPEPFVIAVVLAVAVLLIAIAGAAIRLGPPQAAELERAPSSAEYVDALANLMERSGASDAALREALVATRRRLGRRFGLQDDANAADMAARIGDPALREQFLNVTAVALRGGAGDDALVRGVAVLSALRKEYGIDDPGR
jgi:hypothetical protein